MHNEEFLDYARSRHDEKYWHALPWQVTLSWDRDSGICTTRMGERT